MTSSTRGASAAHSESGLELRYIEPSVRPQDDFFSYVNGQWLREREIPADRSIDGAFLALRDLSEERVRGIITDAPTSSLLGSLYSSFVDEKTIKDRGLSVLGPDLDVLRGATNHLELAQAMAKLEQTGVAGLVGAYVNNDAKESTKYVLYLVQYGISLPDESYYRDPVHAQVLSEYREHVSRMLQLGLGIEQETAARSAELIVALEADIAAAHWDVVARRDADKTYNPTSLRELVDQAPGFPWFEWLSEIGIDSEAAPKMIAAQPDFLSAVGVLWESKDVSQWKLWLEWRVLSSRAPYLTDELVEENFAFFGRTLSGAPENKERWKRAVRLVEGAVGEEVGKEYVSRFFPPRHKAEIQQLVDNVIAAYRSSIADLEWMTPRTRQRALAKLDAFTPKVGYPDSWRDYSELKAVADDLVGNVRRSAQFDHDYEMAKLGCPVDKGEWHMTPQTVNAYYNPVMNEIVFPAAILQPPFFDIEADPAVNYGGIGAVIGHEIGHGFDDQGSKYDGAGNLVNWWTDDDRREFGVRVDRVIEQFDGLTPEGLNPESDRVNGAFTVGENIGDLGGLGIALEAYRLHVGGSFESAPKLDGLTGVQRLLMSWAVVWRTKTRKEEAIRRLATDPHSPPEFRCNIVVSNLNEFYEAFGVQEGDAHWLSPEQRVRIWS